MLPRTARLRRCLVHRHASEPGGAALAQVAVGLDVVENRIVNLRIGLAGAVRAPQRTLLAEAVLTGLDPRAVGPAEVRACAAAAAAEMAPLDDGYASAGYRRDLVAELSGAWWRGRWAGGTRTSPTVRPDPALRG